MEQSFQWLSDLQHVNTLLNDDQCYMADLDGAEIMVHVWPDLWTIGSGYIGWKVERELSARQKSYLYYNDYIP